jgi:hypothetical protein
MKITETTRRLPLALGLALALALTAPFAQAQGGGGGGGHTEKATANLSYPAAFSDATVTLNGTPGEATFTGTLGTTWSYGCAVPEDEFPNTSCVLADGTVMTYDECVLRCGATMVERIYWQRATGVAWQAESVPAGTLQWPATFLDWGDNLESVSWTTRSTIRVETTPFTTLLDPALCASVPAAEGCRRGFQMWHVFGKGTDELWGARATNAEPPLPYAYESPYAIEHTASARLNIAKLEAGTSACPTAYTPSPYNPTWDPLTSQWSDSCLLRDTPFTAELNIGGKFVYGYNWRLKRDVMCPGWSKAGWWRLTFYAPTVLFNDAAIPLVPPTLPPAAPVVTAEPGGTLYRPVIDTSNNLTYIDICVVVP